MGDEFEQVMGSRRGRLGSLPAPPERDHVVALYEWLLDVYERSEALPADDDIARHAEALGLDASVEMLSQGEYNGNYVVDVYRLDGGRRALIVYPSLLPDYGTPVLYRA